MLPPGILPPIIRARAVSGAVGGAIGGAGTRTATLPPGIAPPIHMMKSSPAAKAASEISARIDTAKRGRPDKAERAKEERRAASARITAFAETKPSRRTVREFFASRIAELKDM